MSSEPYPAPSTSPLLRIGLMSGGLAGLAGVALLAAGAHVDPTGFMDRAGTMFLFHAPALAGLGLLAQMRRAPLISLALPVMILGLLLFCGDMVVRSLADHHLFAMAAPSGGIAIMIAWALVALSALACGPRPRP